jgi:hypothetical protein
MPQIIPIRDLKNTTAISQMCHDVYAGLATAEAQVAEGRTIDADESLRGIRERYSV